MFVFTHKVIVLYRFEDGLLVKRTPLQRSVIRKHDVSSGCYTERRQVAIRALALYRKISPAGVGLIGAAAARLSSSLAFQKYVGTGS